MVVIDTKIWLDLEGLISKIYSFYEEKMDLLYPKNVGNVNGCIMLFLQ
jgi:hypothetical protein